MGIFSSMFASTPAATTVPPPLAPIRIPPPRNNNSNANSNANANEFNETEFNEEQNGGRRRKSRKNRKARKNRKTSRKNRS